MPGAWFYTLLSVFIVSLISLVGVLAVALSKKFLETTLLFLVSFAAGGLLGDAFLHLLPEIIEGKNLTTFSAVLILAGILVFFVLEKFIAWRHCHVPTSENHPHPVVFMNLIGDALHNFIDGAVIAASFLISLPLGIATAIAVIFHEIPQEIGDFGVLLHGGFGRQRALLFNFISSLTAFGGALIILVIGRQNMNVMPYLVAMTAGGFIYIAGSDLIPLLHKETEIKKSLVQFLGLISGIGIMLLLNFIE